MTSKMRKLLIFLITSAFIYLLPLNSTAKQISEKDIPDTLKPWAGWVLHDFEEKRCPSIYNNFNTHRCLWPSRLELRVNKRGGVFTQQWEVLIDNWVYLPGEQKYWPQDVTSNGKPVSVVVRNGQPAAYLKKGTHFIKGAFAWKEIPEALQVPVNTGILKLRVNNKGIEFPNLDIQGKLWLKGRDYALKGKEKEDNRLDLKVYRHVLDEIPLKITTRIELDVAGEHREELLGRAMNEGYIPMFLSSQLPARLEPDGSLRIQVRPGRWTVDLTARIAEPIHEIILEKANQLVKEEIWVFEARPALRMVSIEGVTVINPQQTTLPDKWRHLPAYRIKSGETFNIIEKKRGDPDPAPDQLTLKRDIWLDFDGKGYTLKDRISGSMRRSWRLDMEPSIMLGRVAIDGSDQFITQMGEDGSQGIEVRKGEINLEADSRLARMKSNISAVGWQQDFHKVSGQLHLPAGWRLFNATGVDYMGKTWIKRWNLLDLFIVLIIALSFMKLWSRPWGLAALISLVLLYHEPGAPRFVWLNILASVALLRVLPRGKARNIIEVYRWLALLTLIMISIPFIVNQVRQGIYPQLEKPWQTVGQTSFTAGKAPTKEKKVASPAVPQEILMEEMADFEDEISSIKPRKRLRSEPTSYYSGQMLEQYDPKATIQTGPGVPEWRWNSFNFSWNGPVEKDQTFSLILIPPAVNMILCFVRVILLCILALKMLGIEYKRKGGFSYPSFNKPFITSMLLISVLLSGLAGVARADIPSNELLKELRSRLLEKPECAPQCADSQRITLNASPKLLRIRMEVQSYADVSVPLPGQARHWLPSLVLLNGKKAKGLYRSTTGHLWVNVPKGRHQLLLEGPLPDRKSVQIPFLLSPHRVHVDLSGWSLEGLHDDGLTDGQIQLNRIEDKKTKQKKKEATLEATTLPPFVRVERTLQLGLTWQVKTKITRQTSPGSAVLLEVPLIAGESVTSEHIRVKNGKAQVNMAPGMTYTEWSSVMNVTDQIALKSSVNNEWTEIWRLSLSPVWHAKFSGIPPIHHQDSRGNWLPEWRPWPGEALSIALSRPVGIEGQTLTIDKSLIEVTPGQRATDSKLSLSIRSSRGGQHEIILPEESKLIEAKINSRTQPIRQEGRSVTIPIIPGPQMVELIWRTPKGIDSIYVTPTIDIGKKSVNARIQTKMPQNRWILFTDGPVMGPAVLFWGILLVILLIATGLGYLPITPLKIHHWMLLCVGLSQLPLELAAIVVFWLIALGLRSRLKPDISKNTFNGIQAGLVILTLAALSSLFGGISQGLLGNPEMHISGNGSSSYMLNWYQDRCDNLLPTGSIISVPLMFYRFLMLAWSLWIASALIGWLKWGWECFSTNGIWQKTSPVITKPSSKSKEKKEK